MIRIIFLLLLIYSLMQTAVQAKSFPDDFYSNTKHSTYYVVETQDGKKGILLNNGNLFIQPSTKEIEIPLFGDEEIKYDGKTYYIDVNSNVYEISKYIPLSENAGIAVVNGKYGVLERRVYRTFVLPPKYDYIEYLDKGFAKVLYGGKYALYEYNKNILGQFKYNDVRIVKKGKFDKTSAYLHYYVQEKTGTGWHYVTSDVYKELPKRIYEDTVLYYMLGGFMWDSLP